MAENQPERIIANKPGAWLAGRASPDACFSSSAPFDGESDGRSWPLVMTGSNICSACGA